jgi:uncharacterized protein YndB with AHSA1/START domain
MASNEYRFVTRWQLPATPERVYAALENPLHVAMFWPSLYREVRILEPGDVTGLGKVVEAVTRGFLPYDLHWRFRVTSSDRPNGYAITAFGDLVGRGTWSFVARDGGTDATYVWEVLADKPLLRWFSFILKPLFAANHNWVMRRGERGLLQELSSSSV